MGLDVFDKTYDQLSDDEKKVWEAAYEVLRRGDRLFNMTPETTSHVGWALGFAIQTLKKTEHPQTFMMFELGYDKEAGYSIRLITP